MSISAEKLLAFSLDFSLKLDDLDVPDAASSLLKETLTDQVGLQDIAFFWKSTNNRHFLPFPHNTDLGFPSQELSLWDELKIETDTRKADGKRKVEGRNLFWRIWQTGSGNVFLLLSGSSLHPEGESRLHLECIIHKWMMAWENLVRSMEIERNGQQLTMIRTLSEELGKTHKLKPLLSRILKLTIALVDAERGFIMLVDDQDGMLKLEVVHGLPNPEAEKMINDGLIQTAGIPPGKGVQGEVLQTRKAVKIDEVTNYRALGLEEGIDTIICVPLVMNGNAFGVIYVTNKKNGSRFLQRDLDLVSIFAGTVATVIDQARLFRITVTDALTGLFTRRYFMPNLETEIRRCTRYKRDLSILAIDADLFKNVNDSYGHQAGDEVLKSISQVIQAGLRANIDIPCRYGGEEFFILLPETPTEGAMIVAERIRTAMEERKIHFGKNIIQITLSIGVATFPSHGDDQDSILKSADDALYKSKKAGRNKVTLAKKTASD